MRRGKELPKQVGSYLMDGDFKPEAWRAFDDHGT